MTNKEFKKQRKKLGLTQEDLAHELGLCVRTIQYYEKDRSIPRLVEWAMMGMMNNYVA